MKDLTFGRLRDLGGLPDLTLHLAGEEGLGRAFCDQGLPTALLQSPDAPVPMRDLVGLYQRTADVVCIRSLGLDASRDIRFEEHGPVAEYILQAHSLLEALERLRVSLPYHEGGSSIEIRADGDELRVGYRNTHQQAIGWRHAGDFTLCLIVSLIKAYMGSDWQPSRIEVCCEKGPWIQDHEDCFLAPIRYERDLTAVFIDREEAMSSSGVRNKKPERNLTLGDLDRLQCALPQNILEAVSHVIGHRLIDGVSDLEGAAAKLGLGPRTLQRRLGDFGTSYRELLRNLRIRRAQELLTQTDYPVGQIALNLGYASSAQFIRAYKAEIGCSPTMLRREKASSPKW